MRNLLESSIKKEMTEGWRKSRRKERRRRKKVLTADPITLITGG
jgi:hypothetical protein